MASKQKVYIIGLDGGDPDLIAKWAAEGKLPTFARLLEEGAYGPLESAPNQRSAAAWTTFMTGKNPGKHGIYEFYEYSADLEKIEFLKGGDKDGASMWALLSQAGNKVGIINVPMTYPAEPVDGFLICGLDAPGRKSKRFAHPPEILEEVESRFGEYILEPGLTGLIVAGKIDDAVDTLFREMDQKANVSKYLAREKEWDLFVTVFRSVDAVQHCFWKYMDPQHPYHDPEEAKKYGDTIQKAYMRVDRAIGEIMDELDDDTTFMIMSDHGFGRKHAATAQINNWLEAEGFLKYKTGGSSVVQSLMGSAYKAVAGSTVRKAKETLARAFPAVRNLVQYQLCFSQIDMDETIAYSDTLYPNIWVNKKRGGGSMSEPEYRDVVRKLRERLADCRDSESGEPVFSHVLEKNEIYSGPHVNKAPDLLLRWREDIPIHGLAGAERKGREEPFIPGENPRVISGDHHLNGIFFARGPHVRAGLRLDNPRIMDLAPTVLHLMGQEVPKDMDGRVLQELFEASFAPEVKFTEGDSDASLGTDEDYTEEDEAVLRERLKGLGYLE